MSAPRRLVLWIAPHAPAFKSVVEEVKPYYFLFPTAVDKSLFESKETAFASTIVVSAQKVSKDFLEAWRQVSPDADLTLIRRGTSLGSVDVAAAEALKIRVINTPGVNSPHVATYAAKTLGLESATGEEKVTILGAGSVGKFAVERMNAVGLKPTVVTATSQSASPDTMSTLQTERYGFSPEQATLSGNLHDALAEATHVIVCAATSGEPLITKTEVDALLRDNTERLVRICCLSRPEAFCVDAIRGLPSNVQCTFDYGESILAPVREKVNADGVRSHVSWTTKAMHSDACNADMDAAVLGYLAVE